MYGRHSHLCQCCTNELQATLDEAEAHIDANEDEGFANDHPKPCDRCKRLT